MKHQNNLFLKTMSILKDDSHLSMYYAITLPTIRFLPLVLLSYGNSGTHENFDPKRFKAILWLIAGGTRGGPNRIKILNIIGTKSLNAHQIAKELKLDYKTIKYHIKVLEKNSLIIKSDETDYGANYSLTPLMKNNMPALEEIISKIRR